ncbi:hypothetical protein BST61_g8267 [Cercospora zeina]
MATVSGWLVRGGEGVFFALSFLFFFFFFSAFEEEEEEEEEEDAAVAVDNTINSVPLPIDLTPARSCVIYTARTERFGEQKRLTSALSFAPGSMLEGTARDEHTGKHGLPKLARSCD